MKNLATQHSNALASGGTGGATIVLLALLAMFGITLPPLVAGAIVWGASTLILLIGREGVRGLLSIVWRGKPKRGKPKP